jgi:hypothetical protein
MSKNEYIDLIITEDSDLVAYGAKAIVYKLVNEISNGIPRGILLEYETLGSITGTLDFSDFNPEMMAVLFVSLGCDYCDKLKGIGIVTANRIVRKAFFQSLTSPLSEVFCQLYCQSFDRELSDEAKRDYEERFLAALFMYQHPIIYDPVLGKCIIQGLEKAARESALMKHEAYADLCKDQDRITQIVGEIKDPEIASAAATAAGIGVTSSSDRASMQPDQTENPTNTQECNGEDGHTSEESLVDSPQLHTQIETGKSPLAEQTEKEGNIANIIVDNNRNTSNSDSREGVVPKTRQEIPIPMVEQPRLESDEAANSKDNDEQSEKADTASEDQALDSQDFNTQPETQMRNIQSQETFNVGNASSDCEAFKPMDVDPVKDENMNTIDDLGIRRGDTMQSSGKWVRGTARKLYHHGTRSLFSLFFIFLLPYFLRRILQRESKDCENQENFCRDPRIDRKDAHSPNLLHSSSPDKSSQGDHTTQTNGTLSVARSPNLLYSSTPEKMQISQETEPTTEENRAEGMLSVDS